MKYVPDTSVIINGKFYEFIKDKNDIKIIIPEAVVSEIEAQANRGLMIGHIGLDELKKIYDLTNIKNINLEFYGSRPEKWQINKAKAGEIDELIRNVAIDNNAVLVTSDFVQYSIAKKKGINTLYFEETKPETSHIEDFFDSQTMSVHLKANVLPIAKKGKPGAVTIVKIRDIPIDEAELQELTKDIIERAKNDKHSLIDQDYKGATVIQLRNYRIVITKPPFSDTLEITAVRPTVKLSISDYNIDKRLFSRLEKHAEGIIISGAPGAGKSTFVQALAEFYMSKNKIVKTIERPRDLLLAPEITRYTALEGKIVKTGDLLLLVRPDSTIFDEMRSPEDFKVFADLRMAGVELVGVTHASRAIDAVQRLIGKVELGMIPQVIDTVIHIENGKIAKVYVLQNVVKVPTGMVEQDLARPVINVLDFYTGRLEYEIYSFGEQIVVVPVHSYKSPMLAMAEQELRRKLTEYIPDANFKLEILGENNARLYIREDLIPQIIGKAGKNIRSLEETVGVHLDIKPIPTEGKKVKVLVQKKKNHIFLYVGEYLKNVAGQVFADNEYLFNANVSKNGLIKIRDTTENAHRIIQKIKEGKTIYFKT